MNNVLLVTVLHGRHDLGGGEAERGRVQSAGSHTATEDVVSGAQRRGRRRRRQEGESEGRLWVCFKPS